MKDLIETLQVRYKSPGHWRISITMGDAVYYTVTTNSEAIDNLQADDDLRAEAQLDLVNEIIRKNHLDL